MVSFITYLFEEERYTKDMTGFDLDQVLCTASNMYAFADCTDIEVVEVVHEGKRYEYAGWEPGMTYTFLDETGEEVWSRSFPNWDH